MEIRQVRNWLERNQLTYWRGQVKRCNELVSIARTELHRRQLSQSNSDSVSDTDQKEALRKPRGGSARPSRWSRRSRRWIPVLEHATAEYHSQSQPLGDRLAGGFVATINMLDRTIATLESYLAMAPPTTVVNEPAKPSAAAKSQAPGSAAEKAPAKTEAPADQAKPAEPAAGGADAGNGAEAKSEQRQEVAS